MVYDIVFLGILVLLTIVGIRRGLAKTVLSLLSLVAAAVGAVLLSRFLSRWIFDTFIRPSLLTEITSILTDSVIGDAALAVASVISAIPSYAMSAMTYFGVDMSSFESFCQESITEKGTDAAEGIVESIMPSVTGAISTVLMVILFILLVILFSKLSKLLEKFFDLPFLNGLNSLLGGVLGFAEGILVVVLCAALIKLLLPLFSGEWALRGEEYIDTSYIFSFIYSGKLTSWIQLFIYNAEKLMNI